MKRCGVFTSYYYSRLDGVCEAWDQNVSVSGHSLMSRNLNFFVVFLSEHILNLIVTVLYVIRMAFQYWSLKSKWRLQTACVVTIYLWSAFSNCKGILRVFCVIYEQLFLHQIIKFLCTFHWHKFPESSAVE